MSSVYLTSDLHIGHRMVADYRGFSSVDNHDEALIECFSETLSDGDQLWILGDISGGSTSTENKALAMLGTLKDRFDLHLIPGNHDGVHPMHRRSRRELPRYLEVFSTVQAFARRKINGQRVWLSHFPYFGDGDRGPVERYPEVRLHDNGTDWLLHGHLHTEQKVTAERSLHVGLDAWDLQPVPLLTIERLIPPKDPAVTGSTPTEQDQ